MARTENRGGVVEERSGRWIHKVLVAAILVLSIAVPTASQTVQKVPVRQYLVSVMEAVTLSRQFITPEKADSSVCLSHSDNIQNCTQSRNTTPLLLDGQRTTLAHNCSKSPEAQNYYMWNKSKQPRIILVIPHGWCVDYVTLACCRNTEQRIYEPLSVNISAFNSLSEEPQPVNGNYMRETSEGLSRVNLDQCMIERYLEIQLLDPKGFHATLMYHFISEVEVYGHEQLMSSGNTDESSSLTVVISLVVGVSVLLVIGITVAVVVGVGLVKKNRRIQDGQRDYDEPSAENVYAETQIHHRNSTLNSHVTMTTNPAYKCVRVDSPPETCPLAGTTSYCDSTGDRMRQPRDYEKPVPTIAPGQGEGRGYAFVVEDKDKHSAPRPLEGSRPAHGGSGDEYTTSQSQEHAYDYVGDVMPATHCYNFVLSGTQGRYERIPDSVDTKANMLSHQEYYSGYSHQLSTATETTSVHSYI